MKLLQQAPQQQGPGAGGSGWGGASSSGMAKSGKPAALTLLEMHQEADRIVKQQRAQQQQRDRVRMKAFDLALLPHSPVCSCGRIQFT